VGSPITLSGFNQIDFGMILNAVMQQERLPLDRLETQRKALEAQKTAFSTLATKLGALETAGNNLKTANSLNALKATSSGAGVEVSASGGTNTGTYGVVVTERARAQAMASATTYSSLTDVVGTSGTFTITPDTGDPIVITLSASTTIQELAASINGAEDTPVSAAVVQSAPGQYRLVLTGKNTGADNGFTVSQTLAGGVGLAFVDTDGNNIYGDSDTDLTQTARNASFTVNGLAVQSASNVVTDVIPGVTLTLKTEGPDPITIDVTRDSAAAKEKVTKFIDAYNAIVAFMTDQNTAAIAGKASIGRDPLTRGFKSAMREVLMGQYPDATSFPSLAGIGIGFDATGKLTLDNAAFDAAIKNDPADVQRLMSGTTGNGGAFGAITSAIKEYTKAGGLIFDMKQRLTEQVRHMEDRLDQMAQRLEQRRLVLQREFTAADRAMTQLRSQGGALSALGGTFGGF
jgi:flagellar hook-associated protein 2